MRRILLVLLALITLLQCACVSVEVKESETELAVAATETELATETEKEELLVGDPVKILYTNEYAYVRAGVWRSKNWHDILAERKLDSMLILKNGNEETDVTRYMLLRFDLSGITEADVGRAELAIRFTSMQSGVDVPFSVFLVDNNWSEATVTWDSRPQKLSDDPVAKKVLLENQTADVTAAVKAMIAAGEKSITLMILQTEATKSETRIALSALSEEEMPRLIVDRDGVSDAEPIELDAAGEDVRYFYTTEYAYVRNGSSGGYTWGDMNWHDILAARDLEDNRIILKDGEANNHVSRLGLFRFNLGGFAAEDVGYAELSVKFSAIEERVGGVHFDVYLVEDEWNEATVTWNTMPKKLSTKPVISDAVFGSLQRVDATALVKDQLAKGKTTFTLLLVQTDKTNSETKIEFDKVGQSNMPHIKVYREDPLGGEAFVKTFVESEKKNQAIWDRAKQMFDEWYARYAALKEEEARDVEKIVSDPSQFTKTVKSPGSNPSGKMVAHPTRTFDALTDYSQSATAAKTDKYGGLMDASLRQEATGYFYTKKIDDRWWVIDPLGYPCYIRSISGITTSYQDSPKQQAAFEAMYGGDKAQWALATTRHLIDDLGFTTQTSADMAIREVSDGLSYFKRFSIMSGYASAKGINASIGGRTRLSENNTLPVFDPDFEEYAESRIKATVDPDDPYMIGYITDNELAIEDHMLLDYLTIDPSKEVNHYSYACAWYWITQMTGKQTITERDLTPELCDLFRGFVWDRYYNVVDGLLEEYDSNHLYAGTKYLKEAKESEWILRFSGKYLDIITINWYGAWEPQTEYICDFARYVDAPFMVTEFYAKSSDTEDKLPSKDGGGFYVSTQEERGMFYQNYTLRLLEAKNCVGWQWFQYIDNDPTGNPTDQSSRDSNKGIMSNTHKEYTELTDAMKQIHQNVYQLIDYFDAKYSK